MGDPTRVRPGHTMLRSTNSFPVFLQESSSHAHARKIEKPENLRNVLSTGPRNQEPLPPYGECNQQVGPHVGAVYESEENRLKGKLRWLFEQDRMFWELNHAKLAQKMDPEIENLQTSPTEESSQYVSHETKLPNRFPCYIAGDGQFDALPAVEERDVIEKETAMSQLDLGEGGFCWEYQDSDDNEGKNSIITPNTSDNPSLKDLRRETKELKEKCNLLKKEKDFAVFRWQQGCKEMDQAAGMADALRSAIETLLEARRECSTDEVATQANVSADEASMLAFRMAKLRHKSFDERDVPSYSQKDTKSLEGRMERLRKSTDWRNFPSPDRHPKEEDKVAELKARLERLMISSSSAASQRETEEDQTSFRPADSNLMAEHRTDKETSTLKMKTWFNSLSEELTEEEEESSLCHLDRGHFGRQSINERGAQALTQKGDEFSHIPGQQQLNTRPAYDRKKVIHKIAEEVRAEVEQWSQVQASLHSLGEEMRTMQEVCDTWEQRARSAEAELASLQQKGQESEERPHVGETKLIELQTEMMWIRKTMDEIRVHLLTVNPIRSFEEGSSLSYAFFPILKTDIATIRKRNDACGNNEHDCGEQMKMGSTNSNNGDGNAGESVRVWSPLFSQQCPVSIQQWPSTEASKGQKGQTELLTFFKSEDNSYREEEIPPQSHINLQTCRAPESMWKHKVLANTGLKNLRASVKDNQEIYAAREMLMLQEDLLRRSFSMSVGRALRFPLKDVIDNASFCKENKKPK